MNDRYETSFWMVVGLAVLLGAAPAWAQQGGAASQAVQAARQAFRGDDLQGKDGPLAKVGMDLAQLYYRAQLGGVATQGAGVDAGQTTLPVRDGRVRVDAVATGSAPALLAELEALGLERGATAGAVVGGWLPVGSIAEAAQLSELRFARPSLATVHRMPRPARLQQEAPVISQGVKAMRAAEARDQFGVDGSGVTVGVLSDSFNCLEGAADDEAGGEIPSDVLLTEEPDCSSGTDEGRAMVQIIYDVAPGASQRFNTAFGSRAGFAENIVHLADEGAQVIVDDVIYFAEPMFATGPIAQSVNEVYDRGVAYFSSAGNSNGQSYESEDGFRLSGIPGPLEGGPLHDFDPDGNIDPYQDVTLPVDATVTISLQWPQPYPSAGSTEGASTDLDLVLVDENGNVVENEDGDPASATFDNIGNDPVEVLQFTNDGSTDADGDGTPDTQFRLGIERVEGSGPDELIKYVYSSKPIGSFSLNEYDESHSTLYGHANARGAEAVGASLYFRTPAFDRFPVAIIRPFSALGGTPIYFDENGSRLSTPRVPMKPEVVGPDGVNNTFFGSDFSDTFDTGENIPGENDDFPNFSGTSAAAPHVAGVAALMKNLNTDLNPSTLYQALEETALDMDPIRNGEFDEGYEGFDFKTGYGFVDAVAALDEVPVSLRVQSQVIVVDGESQVELSVTTETPQEAERFIIARCFGTRDECGTGGDGYERVQTIEATGERAFTFTTDVPTQSGTYTFVVRQQNRDGGSTLVRTTEVTLDLAGGVAFELTEAFPSPFQSRTELRLVVGQNESIDVTATLYDALGRRVRTIFDESVQGQTVIPLPAGDLSSGVYFIRVRSENFLETRSVVLVR